MISQVLTQFFNQGVISSRNALQPQPQEILVRRLPSTKETLERARLSLSWNWMRGANPRRVTAGT